MKDWRRLSWVGLLCGAGVVLGTLIWHGPALAQQRAAAYSGPKWEYLLVTEKERDREGIYWEDYLNKMGQEGWEAIHIQYDFESGGTSSINMLRGIKHAWLKRPKK